MTRRLLTMALLAVLAGASLADAAGPLYQVPRRWVAARYPWHGAYYDPAWGAPTALVVPPTASLQTKWSWGVTNTDVVPIYHQFSRQYPGASAYGGYGYGAYGYGPYGFIPTPPIPGSTDQFGVYYVRGPW